MALVLHIISVLISIAAVFLVLDGLITRRRVLARIANRGRSDDAKEVAAHAVAEVRTSFAKHVYGRSVKVSPVWRKNFEQQLSLAEKGAQYEPDPTYPRSQNQTYLHFPQFAATPFFPGDLGSRLLPDYFAVARHDVRDDSKLTSWIEGKPVCPDPYRYVFPVAVAGDHSETEAAPVFRESRYHEAGPAHYVQKVPSEPPKLLKETKAARSLGQ